MPEWEERATETGVRVEEITLSVDGDDVPTVLCRPAGPAPRASGGDRH